ncbi:MAG: hypothetical protein NZ988_03230 [Thaumarchaeota archaeon]|nr:hypothetical protein [Candidatus Calditenuaceae archaeon]MDW8187044.1 hypothetical protein [Nitrososphaerota archaeon]
MSVIEGDASLVVNGCSFVKKAFYDLRGESWYISEGDVLRMGLLPTTQFKWGKITSVKPKAVGTIVEEGRSLAFVEAKRFVGHVPAKFRVEVSAVNEELRNSPHLSQTDPYGLGWIVKVKPLEEGYALKLEPFHAVADILLEEVKRKGIVCFKEVPDMVMAAIGVECSQALMVLSERIEQVSPGQIIHLVAEGDENSEREVRTWSTVTGHELLDFMREGRLAHALIRRRH